MKEGSLYRQTTNYL